MDRARVWVPGRTVRGFFGGLLIGFGAAFILHAFKVAAFDDYAFTYLPLACAVVVALRARFGTPYKRSEGTTET